MNKVRLNINRQDYYKKCAMGPWPIRTLISTKFDEKRTVVSNVALNLG